MRIQFAGSGDAFGSGGRRQTCIHLTDGDQAMLVDCGTTILTGLKACGLDVNSISAIAVSHLHGDHFGGIPFLILDGQFSDRTAPLVIAGPPGTRERLNQAMETLFPGSTGVRRRFEISDDLAERVLDLGEVSRLAIAGTSDFSPVVLLLNCRRRVVGA